MEKNDCDFVLANDLQEIGADFHKGYLIHKDGSCDTMETNEEIADRIAQRVMTACRERGQVDEYCTGRNRKHRCL